MNSENIAAISAVLERTWGEVVDATTDEQAPFDEDCRTKLFVTALSVRVNEEHCSGGRSTTLTWHSDGSLTVHSEEER